MRGARGHGEASTLPSRLRCVKTSERSRTILSWLIAGLEPLLDALHARNAHRAPRYSAATATSAMNCDSHFFRRLTFSR